MSTDPVTPALGDVRDARRELYRQQILNAAEIEFGRAGYVDTKVSAIAQTAGLSLATVYKSFGGKTEIWDDLHAARMASLLAEVEAAAVGRTALDRLVAGVAATAGYLVVNEAYLDLSIRAAAGWAIATDEARGVQQTVWSAGLQMIVTGIEAAQRAGDVRELRPAIAAGLIVSALQVWLTDWVATGRRRPSDEIIAELAAHVRHLLAPA